ncbi:MAG TPA: hypothetical protein DHS57_05730 [Erysipelotrichaceae bacterium]|nr:hypothetical protein [Erysipelotrichaceae bacterium]HCY06758.1 hypothetical protein [Erysipelotrichaceae bacterium]
MICAKCKKEIPEEATVCPHCNEKVETIDSSLEETESKETIQDNNLSSEEEIINNNETDSIDEGESSIDNENDLNISKEESIEESKPIVEPIKAKKNFLDKKILIIVASVVAIIVLVFVTIHFVNDNKYNKGLEMLENKNYQEAYTIFSSLKSYNDSSDKAEYAQKGIKYVEAKALMEQGDYVEAENIFNSIDDFENSKDLSLNCQSNNNYKNALALIDSTDYQSALDLLYQVNCIYIDGSDNPDYECENIIKYVEAINAFGNGQNYEAYKKFISLNDFKDSSQKASECIVPKPNTGITYHNEAYKGSACSLKIVPTSDGSSTYFKIYDETGTVLIANIFINAGDTFKINLPAGKYTLRSAYSYKDWFGEVDMFGDEGIYQKIKANDTSEIFTLEKNWDYTLTLRTLNPEGTPIPTKNIDKDSF